MCKWHSGLKTMTRNESELFTLSGMCPIVILLIINPKGTAPLTSLDHVLFLLNYDLPLFSFFFFFLFSRFNFEARKGIGGESEKKVVLFDVGTVKELRPSTLVRTRKMVNYAWVEWSQRKLWWKLVSILTCKSFVQLGYRGDRPIEPSSCWFPPKFPSG